jgi:cysteine synthase A
VISRSTPNYRFDAATTGKPAPSAAAANDSPTGLDQTAVEFFERTIAGKEQPVVLFALEWCEFCWAVRKLFARLEVPYRAIDLDSVAYQENDLGGKIRAVLLDRLGSPTIPQIFIAGEHIGGATDMFECYRNGGLEERLSALGVGIREMPESFEPASLLPGWLHKR